MVIQIVLARPVLVLGRGKNRSVPKGQNVAGQILFDLDSSGNKDLIFRPDAHKAFIEGPVAEAAKGKAVRGPVIVALAPGLDVGSLDHCVALRGEHPDPAQRAAVLVKGNDGFSKPLIPNSLL